MGSPPFRPVAFRTAALMPIMCRPPITATVLRYSCPLRSTSTGGRRPAPSRSITSTGTTMPVVLPLAATVVSNAALAALVVVMSLQTVDGRRTHRSPAALLVVRSSAHARALGAFTASLTTLEAHVHGPAAWAAVDAT